MRGWYDFSIRPPLHKGDGYEYFDSPSNQSDRYYVQTDSSIDYLSSNCVIRGDPYLVDKLVCDADVKSGGTDVRYIYALYGEEVYASQIVGGRIFEFHARMRHGTSEHYSSVVENATNYALDQQTFAARDVSGGYRKHFGRIFPASGSVKSTTPAGYFVATTKADLLDQYHMSFDVVAVYLFWGTQKQDYDKAQLWYNNNEYASENCQCGDSHILIPP